MFLLLSTSSCRTAVHPLALPSGQIPNLSITDSTTLTKSPIHLTSLSQASQCLPPTFVLPVFCHKTDSLKHNSDGVFSLLTIFCLLGLTTGGGHRSAGRHWHPRPHQTWHLLTLAGLSSSPFTTLLLWVLDILSLFSSHGLCTLLMLNGSLLRLQATSFLLNQYRGGGGVACYTKEKKLCLFLRLGLSMYFWLV